MAFSLLCAELGFALWMDLYNDGGVSGGYLFLFELPKFGSTCSLRPKTHDNVFLTDHLYPVMTRLDSNGRGLFQDDSAPSTWHENSMNSSMRNKI